MADKAFTLNDLRAARLSGARVPMLTCYDYTTATHLEQAGVSMLLVGDSASNVILGHSSTLPVSLDFMIQITAAVRRGAPKSLVIGDMPFGSYHESDAQGVRNVCRMIQESSCCAVKIEAGAAHGSLIARLADAGVATIAHIGLRPQAVGLYGYKFQGRTVEEADQVISLAVELARAGAASILLEAVTPEVAAAVVKETNVPIIGCGAGSSCHAHVVVLQDLLQLTPRQPKFVPKIELSRSLIDNAKQYVSLVQRGAYPDSSHCYEMPLEERARFLAR